MSPTDPVTRLLNAIERRDAGALRAVYADGARLVTMTPNTFEVADGAEAAAEKLMSWYATWEEDPSFSFTEVTRGPGRAVLEFERVSTYEGEPWVARQCHAMEIVDGQVREHRIYCVGPRQGAPELAAAVAAGAR